MCIRDRFISELVEYDSVVNQFFLPMIKQKFDEPKEQLEKEIKEQNNKLERIKKAYINGVFELKEYNEEKKIVEKSISELESKLDTTDCVEELRLSLIHIYLCRCIGIIIVGLTILQTSIIPLGVTCPLEMCIRDRF